MGIAGLGGLGMGSTGLGLMNIGALSAITGTMGAGIGMSLAGGALSIPYMATAGIGGLSGSQGMTGFLGGYSALGSLGMGAGMPNMFSPFYSPMMSPMPSNPKLPLTSNTGMELTGRSVSPLLAGVYKPQARVNQAPGMLKQTLMRII